MTPAEELRAAATKIRDAAKRAQHQGDRWSVDVAGPVASLGWLGASHDVLTATWPQAAHVDMWKPSVAVLVAGWLWAVAVDDEQDLETYHRVKERTAALAIARAINGGA